jgi:hypothetical protein
MSKTARMSVKVEVEVVVGTWDASATFSSLREQIKREALGKLKRAIAGDNEVAITKVTGYGAAILDSAE